MYLDISAYTQGEKQVGNDVDRQEKITKHVHTIKIIHIIHVYSMYIYTYVYSVYIYIYTYA